MWSPAFPGLQEVVHSSLVSCVQFLRMKKAVSVCASEFIPLTATQLERGYIQLSQDLLRHQTSSLL